MHVNQREEKRRSEREKKKKGAHVRGGGDSEEIERQGDTPNVVPYGCTRCLQHLQKANHIRHLGV